MKKLTAFVVLAMVMLAGSGLREAQAQLRMDLAPNVGYGFMVFNQVGDPGTLSIGAQMHLFLREGDKPGEPDRKNKRLSLIFNPAFDYYLFDIQGMSGFQLDGNLLLALGRRQSVVVPYGGLGLAVSIVTGEEDPVSPCPVFGLGDPCRLSDVTAGTNFGLNLLGGFRFGAGSPRILTQVRYTIGEHDLHRADDADPSSGISFHGGILFRL